MSEDKFYILKADYSDEAMGLGPIILTSDDDNWMFGQPFVEPPQEPICVTIDEGEDEYKLIDFFLDPCVGSDAFVEALLEVGVDNIVTYDVILQSEEDPSFIIEGYKAINIIGLVKAAGPGTVYLTES